MHRELLLNLINSQWFGGAAFIIYTLVYKGNLKPFWNVLITVILGLTRPFCIFLFPFLCIKYFITHKKENSEIFYTVFFIFCIQLSLSLSFNRFSNSNSETFPLLINYETILFTLKYIILGYFYNPTSPLKIISVVVILISIIYQLRFKQNERFIFNLFLGVSFLMLLGFMHKLFTVHSQYYLSLIIMALDSSRYLFIPHYLFAIGGILLVRHSRLLSHIFVSCLFIISIVDFSFLKSDKIHFQSFVNFSRYENILAFTNPLMIGVIPISTWFFYLERDHHQKLPDDRKMSFKQTDMISQQAKITEKNGLFQILFGDAWNNRYADIEFTKLIDCKETKDIGLTFEVSSSVPVRIEFSIHPLEQNVPYSSISLYQYSSLLFDKLSSMTKRYIALPFPKDNTKTRLKLRLIPYQYPIYTQYNKVETRIKDLALFCLPAEGVYGG